jgi:hypothetical protein
MMAIARKITGSLITPVSWTIITIILLCLPGSSFPGEGVFIKIPHIDKIVHVVLFGGLVLLWGLYFFLKKSKTSHLQPIIVMVILFAIILGICMEYIQLKYVPKRAFDKGDIIANTVSSILFGTLFFFKKQR